jgi:hypothetical protein
MENDFSAGCNNFWGHWEKMINSSVTSPSANALTQVLTTGVTGHIATFLEGIGDGASFGLTSQFRNALGVECYVQKDGFYYGGVVTGIAATTIVSGGAADAEGVASARLVGEPPDGFSSFGAAKRALGSPGEGNVFDHVVEQSQINRSGFASEEAHNPFNMNPVRARTNQIKANYYSGKQPFSGNQTVRDWLTGQPFQDQYTFGMDVLARIRNGAIK